MKWIEEGKKKKKQHQVLEPGNELCKMLLLELFNFQLFLGGRPTAGGHGRRGGHPPPGACTTGRVSPSTPVRTREYFFSLKHTIEPADTVHTRTHGVCV